MTTPAPPDPSPSDPSPNPDPPRRFPWAEVIALASVAVAGLSVWQSSRTVDEQFRHDIAKEDRSELRGLLDEATAKLDKVNDRLGDEVEARSGEEKARHSGKTPKDIADTLDDMRRTTARIELRVGRTAPLAKLYGEAREIAFTTSLTLRVVDAWNEYEARDAAEGSAALGEASERFKDAAAAQMKVIE